jgi:hypothetical protein
MTLLWVADNCSFSANLHRLSNIHGKKRSARTGGPMPSRHT